MGVADTHSPMKFSDMIQSEEIESTRKELCLQICQVHQIYEQFARLDVHKKGFLELDDFALDYEAQDIDFVELPYLQYFFKLIHKKKKHRVFFEQFLPSVVCFCLMDEQSLLRFVFNFIDTDGDERITRSDIVKAANYRNPKSGQQTFFASCAGTVQSVREIQMDFSQFRQSSNKSDFLIWPAFKFQQGMRDKIIGKEFWKELYVKVEKLEHALKNMEKKTAKMKEKAQQLMRIPLKKPQELLMDRSQYKSRTPHIIATDACLEGCTKRERRRSCPYLKPDLLGQLTKRKSIKGKQ